MPQEALMDNMEPGFHTGGKGEKLHPFGKSPTLFTIGKLLIVTINKEGGGSLRP